MNPKAINYLPNWPTDLSSRNNSQFNPTMAIISGVRKSLRKLLNLMFRAEICYHHYEFRIRVLRKELLREGLVRSFA